MMRNLSDNKKPRPECDLKARQNGANNGEANLIRNRKRIQVAQR